MSNDRNNDRGDRRNDGDRGNRGDRNGRRDFGSRDFGSRGSSSSSRDGSRGPRRGDGPRSGGRDGGARFGDRPAPRQDRHGRDDRADRPRYDGAGRKPFRDDDRRPRRDDDRRPRRDDRGQGERSFREDRPRRDFGDRPRRDDRPHGDRPFRGDRPRRDDRGSNDRFDNARGRGGTRGGGRSDRGGADREFTEAERLQHSLRPVRAEHEDPIIPDDIRPNDLHPAARNELKTLQVELQERVARHLAMVALLIDTDPALAHEHALSASRRAGRIPVTRETLAITAYRNGDFALALRELRTYRRLTGSDAHLALMIDCERGLGRPQKALETGLEAKDAELDMEQRVHVAIAMSGARLDLGQTQQALFELEIPELDPKRAYSWSPELFGAYATVLEDLGREAEAAKWWANAERAAGALDDHFGARDELEVFEVFEHEGADADADASAEASSEAEAPEGAEDEAAPAEDAPTVDADEAPAEDAPAEDAPADDAGEAPAAESGR